MNGKTAKLLKKWAKVTFVKGDVKTPTNFIHGQFYNPFNNYYTNVRKWYNSLNKKERMGAKGLMKITLMELNGDKK